MQTRGDIYLSQLVLTCHEMGLGQRGTCPIWGTKSSLAGVQYVGLRLSLGGDRPGSLGPHSVPDSTADVQSSTG